MSLFSELKRRNVFRVAAAYVVLSWLLLQVGDVLFDGLELPSSWNKGLIAIIALGFIPAVVFSWAYELTPEGIRKESEIDRSESITGRTARKLDLVTIAIVLLGVGFALFNHYVLKSTPAPARGSTPAVQEPAAPSVQSNTIAVLPFADLSPAGDQEYFSQGIAEEILNVLVRIDGLEVASRTSSFQFAGRDLGIPAIAEELKVRHVLEGSLRKAGDTLRITAQLIDAENDRHVWSETYDRPLTAENVFQIQDDIASAIVSELGRHLGPGHPTEVTVEAATDNLDAYELYLQARRLYLAREHLDRADGLLARATELDPSFAEAWELRAPIQLLQISYGFVQSTDPEAVNEKAREFARRALALDEESATALATLALIERLEAWDLHRPIDLTEVLAKLDRALAIEPRNGSALVWRGLFHVMVGDLEAGLGDFEACVRYEPLYSACETNLQVMLGILGRDEEALERFLASLDKGVPKVMLANLPMLARLGREDLFKTITNGAEALAGWRRHDDVYTAFRNPDADHGDLLAQLTEFLDSRDADRNTRDVLLGPLGTRERLSNPVMVWEESVKPYRRSPVFQRQIIDSGVLDYWREQGFPDQCRPLGDEGFECD